MVGPNSSYSSRVIQNLTTMAEPSWWEHGRGLRLWDYVIALQQQHCEPSCSNYYATGKNSTTRPLINVTSAFGLWKDTQNMYLKNKKTPLVIVGKVDYILKLYIYLIRSITKYQDIQFLHNHIRYPSPATNLLFPKKLVFHFCYNSSTHPRINATLGQRMERHRWLRPTSPAVSRKALSKAREKGGATRQKNLWPKDFQKGRRKHWPKLMTCNNLQIYLPL